MIYACYPQPKTCDSSCAIIVTSQNVIGFEAYQFLHCEHMANSGLKYNGRYCVAGGPNRVSCKNTSHTSGISMHCFPKDEGLRRLWTQFVMHHRTKLAPSQYSALCSDLFALTSIERKLLLGAEAVRKPSNLLNKTQ